MSAAVKVGQIWAIPGRNQKPRFIRIEAFEADDADQCVKIRSVIFKDGTWKPPRWSHWPVHELISRFGKSYKLHEDVP